MALFGFIADLWTKLIASFDNSSKGFSARKLSAFAAVIMGVYATVHYVETVNVIEALHAWLLFALLCMGIVTLEQVANAKSKLGAAPKQEPPKEEPKKEPLNEEKDPVI